MMLKKGSVKDHLDKYSVLDKLNLKVFKAIEKQSNRVVAIKIIDLEGSLISLNIRLKR